MAEAKQGPGLSRAQAIIEAVLEAGAERGLKPLSVVVLDAGGHVVAFARQDGASPGRFGIAHGKAYGAAMLHMGGRAQMQRAEAQAYFMTAANGVFGGAVVPVPGGVLLRAGEGGPVVGAVGVTGDSSDNDAEAAMAGIAAAGGDLAGEA